MLYEDKTYNFKAKLWEWSGKGAWHFVTVPIEISEELNFIYSDRKRGWGSLPVQVTIGSSTWKTSIFPDKKSGLFLLPIKASIRKLENLIVDKYIATCIKVII